MKRELVIAAFSGLTLGVAAFVVYRELKKEKKYIEVPKNKDEEPEEKPAEPEKHEDESKSEEATAEYDEESELPLEEEIFMVVDEKPYRITEDEHNTGPIYETETLTYYADGALADTSCQLVNDITDIFGSVTELTEAFADDDVDVVWMRNDVIGYDYEIVRDPRRYIDIVKANPYLMGGYYNSEDDEE